MWAFYGFYEVIGGRVRIGSWMVFPALYDAIGSNLKKVIYYEKKNQMSKFNKKSDLIL